MMRLLTLVLLILSLSACAQFQRLVPARFRADERLARSVTIVRDEWGVPTIYAPTDAGVMFGLAYAQAEDNYWQIEDDYIHALGRAANYYGDSYLAADLLQAAFEVERLSREEYAREPAERRALWDAFAAGLNYYTRTQRVQSRLIARFEPWMLFARFRTTDAGTTIDGVRLGDAASIARQLSAAQAATSPVIMVGHWTDSTSSHSPDDAHVSTAWAVAPTRAAAGHALLLQSPHAAFFGTGQPYELHLQSAAGWHFRGFALLGTPALRAGHNEQLGWGHTNTAADHADVYEVTFDHPSDSLMYRYDGAWRRADRWTDTLLVNTANGVVPRVFSFLRTHHGPVVAQRDGKALAVRVARMTEGGSLQQWYAMGRATSLDAFRAALGMTSLPAANTMYADQLGNILYVHGNAVPARDTAYDWTKPVDGSSAITAWRGYHALADLPQLFNPQSGWLQSTGGNAFLATADTHNLDRARYPKYMAPESDSTRARSARRVLAREAAWTFDGWTAAAFDRYVLEAENAVARLVLEWEQIGGTNPDRAMNIDEPLDKLRAWDRTSSIESPEMTLFTLWQERLRTGEYDGAFSHFRAFEDVVARLKRDWSSALVPWGELNRLQRVHTSGAQPFSDERSSLPVAGGPASLGIIFDINAPPTAGSKRRYGTSGAGGVSAVEFAPELRSRSIVTFGQSADSASAHFFDQAPLYARGELKHAWFTRTDVMAHAKRVYSPAGTVSAR